MTFFDSFTLFIIAFFNSNSLLFYSLPLLWSPLTSIINHTRPNRMPNLLNLMAKRRLNSQPFKSLSMSFNLPKRNSLNSFKTILPKIHRQKGLQKTKITITINRPTMEITAFLNFWKKPFPSQSLNFTSIGKKPK